jgi:hypothetical protein
VFLQFRTIISITIFFLGIFGCAKSGEVLSFSEPFSGSGTGAVVKKKPTLHYRLSLFSGSGNYGYLDGASSAAMFTYASLLDLDRDSNLYVVDPINYMIRQIDPLGEVSTYAGNSSRVLQGIYYPIPEPKLSAYLGFPNGVAVKDSHHFYISDGQHHVINEISSGMLVTYAGNTSVSISGAGFQDGYVSSYSGATEGNMALFYQPSSLKLDRVGNLYVLDEANHAIRKIFVSSSPAYVTTIAGGARGTRNGTGKSAQFNTMFDIAVSSLSDDILYVADTNNHVIRKIDMSNNNLVTTYAGGAGGTATGTGDGIGTAALFQTPYGLTMDTDGYLFVTDIDSRSIRMIGPDQTVETLVIDNPLNFNFMPRFLTIDQSHNLYFTAYGDCCKIFKLTPVP